MPFIDVAIILLLILLNGFFALSELAIVSARRPRLQSMERRGSRGAGRALALSEDPTGFLSTVQIGITLIGIFAGAYSGTALAGPLAEALREVEVLAPVAESAALTLVVLTTTYASLIVGELVPKRLALRHPEAVAARVSLPMSVLARVGQPIVWFLRLSTNAILRLLGAAGQPESSVSEDEVRAMIAEGTEAGIFAEGERRMLERVLRVADQPVRALMVPRPDVVFLSANAGPEQAVETVRSQRYSRYPLCGESMDDVIGAVHVKDLLSLVAEGGADLMSICRKPIFVAPNLPALDLLEQFRASRVHMAIVVDEYGGVAGIVTPIDVLEAVAGHLPEHEEAGEEPAVQREDGSWLIDGDMNIEEAAALLGVDELRAEGYTTLAGLALSQLGHIPQPGAVFEAEGWRFEVVDLDGRRIDKLIASRPEPKKPNKA